MPVVSLALFLPPLGASPPPPPAPAFRFRNDELIKFRREGKEYSHVTFTLREGGWGITSRVLISCVSVTVAMGREGQNHKNVVDAICEWSQKREIGAE